MTHNNNPLFGLRRKAFYFFRGDGRYRTHSPFVYHFYLALQNDVNDIPSLLKYLEYELCNDINNNPETLKTWKEKVIHHNGLSIETYRFGIIVHSDKFAKQNHILRYFRKFQWC
ncbi:MAG: hypothetical protein PHR20_05600 [Bacteroidales bacterium]|nr:hypothetical protein [Bacteroidales bacterium]